MSDLIINIEKQTRKVELEQLYLGNDHENLQENLVFTFDEFVNGQARLEYKINDTKNYIILTKENETYTIPVQNVITIYQEETGGKIEFQLVVTEGTNEEEIPVFKSNIFYLRCRPSINAVNEAPEGYELWIEQANEKLNEMDNLNITASKEEHTTTITITKKDGTEESVEILDGEKGEDGDDYTITQADYDEIAGIVRSQITIPTKVSDLNNDTGFITNTVDNLTNYYKKSETYTQAEINSLISAVSTMSIQVVQELPTQDISTTTIYLVPKTASTNDNYDEYIYVSNAWEHIGSTEVDLSGYQTKIDSSHKLLSDLVDDTSQNNLFVNSTEKTTWNAKYDKPSGGIPSTDLSNGVQSSLTKAEFSVLGRMSDYTQNNRLDLNKLPLGAYLIVKDENSMYLKASYNGNEITGTYSYVGEVKDNLIILIKHTEITNDLSNNTIIGQICATKITEGNSAQIYNQLNSIKITTIGVGLPSSNITINPVTRGGTQTIDGEKTFSTLPKSTVVPTNDAHFVNKKYVDDIVGNIETLLSTL